MTGRILVVDDDDDIREMMSMALESRGYEVATARDGLDALQQVRSEAPPSLIVLDLMMPRMDGEQFLRTLRAGERERIPVVIMSGHITAESTARELHASGTLRKPVDLEELVRAVERYKQVTATAPSQ